MRAVSRLLIVLSLSVLVIFSAIAQEQAQELNPQQEQKKDEKPEPFSSSTFAGLRLRSIGPALTSGRVSAFAVDPDDRAKYYVAVSSGGVWKTVNAGTTWTPVFDNYGSYSIGAITLDRKDPAIIWVGTGELNSQRSVGYGDGLYKSEDAGKSFRKVGLDKSEHIARIVIDPRESKVVYVAAQGPLWGPGGDRGLFKTTDGGKTWKNLLNISENTGVTDVVLDPSNPDIVYAASYQRRRHVWTLIDGGPESAIYKSTDAGATWNKLRSGLPAGEMGRIGLDVSPVEPNVVYATVEGEADQSGIFRSKDRGATWEKMSSNIAQGMYYGQIICDPKNVDRIYIPNVIFQVSDDGGRTIRPLGERSKHVDNHAIWIDPKNTDYYLVGCDGGVYESFDRGLTWHFKGNLPVTQFYDVTVDNSAPFYYVYGGTQDNFSVGGPSRTRSASGITNGDWFVTNGGDGFHSRVDPMDPNIVYATLQYGALVRFDKRTGERIGIQPKEGKGEAAYRWNWDSPLIISPHLHTRLYFAANKIFRSDDRGDSWRAISGDLTRQLDRNKLPVMGKIWGPDAVAKHQSTSAYGNIVALSESPRKEGLIYAGTDDGLIQITEDGGKTWRKVETFPGVPERTFVQRIFASEHDAKTVYALFNNHKNADFIPYLMKSIDTGTTWTSISGNLPKNGPLWAINEDHVNPNLLFVGTEFGLFFTIDGGQKWVQLKGGLPTITVRDLAIQRRENDLVAGTFGRGIYILDDYTPLRSIKPETLAAESQLFSVKDAMLYVESQPYGGRGKAFQGESFYTAPNPPFGATITYYLKDQLKTRRQLRKDAEKKGGEVSYPTSAELSAEAEEEAPSIVLNVSDSSGRVIRRINGPITAGIHRINWDLRYPAPQLAPPRDPNSPDEIFGQTPTGHLVMPGKYSVTLSRRVNGVWTQLGGPQTFNVVVDGLNTMAAADRDKLFEFQQKVTNLQRAVTGALSSANELKTRLATAKRALMETPTSSDKLVDEVAGIDKRLNEILKELRGDQALRARYENLPPSISERVNNIVSEQRMSTARPTQTHINAYNIAAQEFEVELKKLRALVEVDVARLEKSMESVGAPWTPGRVPVWQDR